MAFQSDFVRHNVLPSKDASTFRSAIGAPSKPGTAITQTYSTAAATNPAVTSHTITDNSAGTPSTTAIAALSDGTTYANDVAAIRNNFATLAAELALVKADLLAMKKLDNQIIDDLQSAGIQT